MRVVLLMNSLFTGGAEFSTLSFYGWLIKKGYSIKLVVLKNAEPAYDAAQFGFADVTVLRAKPFYDRLLELKQIIQSVKPDVVHSVLFDANMLGRAARIRYGGFKHLESLVNEMYSANRYADPHVTPLKLNAYRVLDWITQYFGVDHFHANGEAVSQHYQQKLGISTDRITVVPRGRQANSFLKDDQNRIQVRSEFGTGERLLLINLARHEYQKGQDVLLDAFRKLPAHVVQRVQLLLVGREGKLTPLLKQKVKAFHLEDTIVMTGHRSDVNALLAAADVFIFPSRFEGLPGALIEAQAAMLPILCSDIPNNREVASEESAFFFSANDSDSLALGIEFFMDGTKRTKFGTKNLEIFNRRFQIEHVHTSMEDLLKRLTSSNR